MPLHASTRGVLTSLAALAAVWMVYNNPLLARMLPWLTGQCSPEVGPTSRWNDWWGIGWLRFHNQLVDEVVQADKGEGFDLIFYGDSITEDWRGTSGGVPWPIGSGSDEVFQKHFAAKYRAGVLAIAGDQVGHLWWRILNGELPAVHQPRVYTILIGTNDLNAADCNQNETELLATVPGIAARVGEIVGILRTAAPNAHVLLQAVLPRGAAWIGLAQWEWPNRFAKPIWALNAKFQEMAAADPWVHYVDCGPPFVLQTKTGVALHADLLPDGLHPNAAGMDVMASCLEAAIEPLMHEDGSIGAQVVHDIMTSDLVSSLKGAAANSSILELELGA